MVSRNSETQNFSFPVPSKEIVRGWVMRIAFIALICYLAYLVREIWLPFGLALLLAMVLDPVVDKMELKGWNRTWAAAFIFGSFLCITGGLIVLAAPYIVDQVGDMEAQFAKYFPDGSH